MSGPVRTTDTDPDGPEAPAVPAPVMELTPSRTAQLGTQVIHRALPTRSRRTVGAWCFLDHAPGTQVADGVRIGPHPHIGLQTVTWVMSGEVVHTDSLGSVQPIRPGELNLMTAGHGIAHAEQTPQPHAREPVRLVQFWVAQPERTRHGAPAFEHHPTLPLAELPGCRGTVIIGSFAGETSPARADTDHVGVDLVVDAGPAVVPVRAAHEHAVVVLDGHVEIDGTAIAPDVLAYLGGGRDELVIVARERSRLVLLGGSPFETRPLMWWNFVAREHAEIDAAYLDWQRGSERFGAVASELDPVPAPTPPWLRDGEPFRR
jgi:redox-sensitive bicupin YhaK (pirin superfamily)